MNEERLDEHNFMSSAMCYKLSDCQSNLVVSPTKSSHDKTTQTYLEDKSENTLVFAFSLLTYTLFMYYHSIITD